MSANHPTAPTVPDKSAKPYPEFPLVPHAAGVWAKKIRGRMHCFGPWDGPDGALKNYMEQKHALHADRRPSADTEAVMVWDAVNAFLNHKRTLLESNEPSLRTWREYKDACDMLVELLGKRRLVTDLGTDDFAESQGWIAGQWDCTASPTCPSGRTLRANTMCEILTAWYLT
jgi:hypothetical protein